MSIHSHHQQHPQPSEQETLLAIVRGWHKSAIPEYRGFRCAACQTQINAAWHHWLQSDEYFCPVHLCERCEAQFQAGTLRPAPAAEDTGAPGPTPARQPLNNAHLYTEAATRRFREIVAAWRRAQTPPALRAFTCDACGGELLSDPGPDGRPQRQGYHVWWEMQPEQTCVELHFHRECGHALGIASREELAPSGTAGQALVPPAPSRAALHRLEAGATGDEPLVASDSAPGIPPQEPALAPSTTPAGWQPALQTVFRPFPLPTGEQVLIPADLDLRVPEHSSLSRELLHFLIFIPWDDRLLSRIAPPYRDFFQFVLPHLRTRTTDVHIATCFPFADELIQASGGGERSAGFPTGRRGERSSGGGERSAGFPTGRRGERSASVPAGSGGAALDERVIHLAFLLHDVGWSQMSEAEIAASLGVTGLALNEQAMGPKEKHAVAGKALAEQLLSQYAFDPPLTDAQKAWIAQAVLYHDKPWELAQHGDLPLEMKLVCDTDHLWSFTHENFWQDTVRKGIAPPVYLENLKHDLEHYLVTESGKAKARQLLEEREREVAEWARASAAQR